MPPLLLLAAAAAVAVAVLASSSSSSSSAVDMSDPTKPWRERMGKPSEAAAIVADLDPRMRRPARFVMDFVRGQGHEVLLAYGRRGARLTERLADAGTGLRRGSRHELGLAVDLVAARGWWEGPDAEALWPAIGQAVRQWNRLHPDQPLTWGGDWTVPYDPAHVQWAGEP